MLTMMQWLLMAAILRNDNNAYGPVIYETANELARPNRLSHGSVYPTLDLLERRGFLSSAFSKPFKVRGGRSRRYFAVTASGRRALIRSASLAKPNLQYFCPVDLINLFDWDYIEILKNG